MSLLLASAAGVLSVHAAGKKKDVVFIVPHEWTNLSSNPEYAELKARLKSGVLDFQNK